MYDPLALDRQRIEQERLRRRANADIPTRRAPRRSRSRGHVLSAVAALVPHPRHARAGTGCTEARHAVTG